MTPLRSCIALLICLASLGSVFVAVSAPPEKPQTAAKPESVKFDAAPTATNAAKGEEKRIEVELNGHQFSLPEGFTIELVAGPPIVNRPITASFDEEGRLYVSESSGTNDPAKKQLEDKPHRILRLEDTDGDGKFDKSHVFADRLMFPEGTLWHDGSLYVGAPPSIWKFTDTDNDGVADQREEWFKGHTLNGCANDIHGPYLGPDGYIYWCKGAFEQQTYERPVGWDSVPTQSSKKNSEIEAKKTATAVVGTESQPTKPWTTKAAHIFRARPDAPRDPETGSIKTSAIEAVMTGGMDNPVDVVFTPTGERIFSSTFLVHPGGGLRDGLAHAVYGGVYGKDWNVIDSPSHPRTGDVMPVLCHLGAAAPCGLERLQSAAWGREYQDNLFACCFNMRKVTRHVLTPQGATLDCATTDFVVSNNLDFHPTDVLEDADGSLLIVDTGGWYKLCCPTSQLWKPDVLGAIYRVYRNRVRRPTDPYGKSIKWDGDDGHPEMLGALLFDHRSFVRRRASDCLVRLGADAVPSLVNRWSTDLPDWYGREKKNLQLKPESSIGKFFKTQTQRNPLVIATLSRIDHPKAKKAIWQALHHTDFTIRNAALHAISVSRDRDAADRLMEMVVTELTPGKRVAAEALGRIGDESAVEPLLAEAGNVGDDRFLEHSIIYALIEIARPEATRVGLSTSNPTTVKAALIALDQMPNGGLKPEEVAKYLTSPEPLLRETAAWIISRHADWGEALAGYLRERLASGELSDAEQTTLGKQLAQFAKAASVQELLAATVQDKKLPASARLTALRAMLDSKLKELPRSWSAALLGVLSEADLALIDVAVKSVRAIPPHKDDAAAWRSPLLAIAVQSRSHALRGNASPDAPRPVQNGASKPDAERQDARSHAERGNEEVRWTAIRLDALAALPGGLAAKETDDKLFDFLLSQLASDLPVSQRGTAAEVLSKAKLSKPQHEKLTEQFATAGPLEVDRLLGAFEQTTDEQVGQKLIAALKTAPALTALRVDAIKTRLTKYSPSVQEAAMPLYAALNVDLAAQKQRLEETLTSLPPGDIVRGQQVFHHEKSACKACHAIGYLGGKTGPDLTRIGGIRNERDLLESILFPSASFVRSFEPVLIETKDGKVVNGLIRSETPDELVLATGPNKEERVARADLEEMRPSNVSIMPAGLDKQLSPQQLADLIAFLKACR